jgi:hypothetical protein
MRFPFFGRKPNTKQDVAAKASSDSALPPDILWAKRLAYVMDSAFRIPFTNINVGLDPIIGLYPIVGDAVTAAITMYLVGLAVRFRLPWAVVGRLLANVLIDFGIGLVPVVGDLGDAAFKSYILNVALIEKAYLKQYGPWQAGRHQKQAVPPAGESTVVIDILPERA